MKREFYTVGGKTVTAHIPKHIRYSDLENLYDFCNDNFSDYADCFYSKEELKKLRENKFNIFL